MVLEARKHKTYYDKRFVRNIRKNFEEEVTTILGLKDENGDVPCVDDRRTIIDALFDAYIEQTNEVPPGNQVQRLGNWMMVEHLTDPRPDKVTKEDNPVMTKRQLRTRHMREYPSDIIPKTRSFDDNEKPAKKKFTMNLDDI